MTAMPQRAVVLAAGLGTRLRPLTLERPKPLMPIWGVPLLERMLQMLEAWGVREIAVNLHWQADKIRAYLDTRRGGARLISSFEPEILGTGGALRPLRDFLGDAPFWVVNADVVAEHLDPHPLVAALDRCDDVAAAWLEPRKGPRTVEADHQGRITCYRSPTPGVAGTYTFCGVQLVSPRLFTYLPEAPVCTLVEAYEQAMMQGSFVRGITVPGSYWDDAGTIAAYLRIHKERAGDNRTGNAQTAAISEPAVVPADARVTGSVVYGHARILPGSVIKQCVIAGGCVGGHVTGTACIPAAAVADDRMLPVLAALKWSWRETAVSFLGARGSDRTFWRLYHGTARAIAIHDAGVRPENRRYAAHARILASASVPVPRVLAEVPHQGIVVLEDWGDDTLQQRMQRRPERAARWYPGVVTALARMHIEGTRVAHRLGVAMEPAFDEALYAWERALFTQHLLAARYGFTTLPQAVERELQGVAAALQAAPQVVVHRDFQSSNILFQGRRFAFIDFQGMRPGAGAYDLASLLYDPYVIMTSSFREQMRKVYAAYDPAAPRHAALLHEGAVQRLIQALGAFGRLASVGQDGFTRYILPALENLLEVADLCNLDALRRLTVTLLAREQCRGCE